MRSILLKRNKIYLIGVVAIYMFVGINRLNFYIGSEFTTGKVVRIKTWSVMTYYTERQYNGRTNYSAPIIKFSDQNNEVTFQGETDMDLHPGETVKVVYKKNDRTNARVFSFIGFLLPPLLYSLIPLLLLTAAVYSFLDPTDIVRIDLGKSYTINIGKEKNPDDNFSDRI